jgi:hypothetical protein
VGFARVPRPSPASGSAHSQYGRWLINSINRWGHFETILVLFLNISRPCLGQFWDHIGATLEHFFENVGTMCWDNLGLGQYWGHFGTFFLKCWDNVGIIWGPFLFGGIISEHARANSVHRFEWILVLGSYTYNDCTWLRSFGLVAPSFYFWSLLHLTSLRSRCHPSLRRLRSVLLESIFCFGVHWRCISAESWQIPRHYTQARLSWWASERRKSCMSWQLLLFGYAQICVCHL